MSWGKREDMIVHEQEPFNAEPPPDVLATSGPTPANAFYSRNHGPIPEVDIASWSLLIDGQVQTPLRLSVTDLRERFDSVEVGATLQCAGNRRAGFLDVRDIPGEDPWGAGATSTARWRGTRLADVLTAAGLDPAAADGHVAFEAPDVSHIADPPQRYGGSIALSKALSPEVILAWEMNGEPLPRVHGAPVRVVVPGYIGARSVKWVERITVQGHPSANYFQATAYRLLPPEADPSSAGPGDGISLGSVALNTAILAPADGAVLAPGEIDIVGYAFAGGPRQVARVDVSVDGGTSWHQAELTSAGPWTWTRWRLRPSITPSKHDIVARAWDDAGALQPESAEPLWNPKGYANNSWDRISVVVRDEGASGTRRGNRSNS